MGHAIFQVVHGWMVPARYICLAFWVGSTLVFFGLMTYVIGRHSNPELYVSLGFIMMGLGFMAIVMSIVFCAHAYCIIRKGEEEALEEEEICPRELAHPSPMLDSGIEIAALPQQNFVTRTNARFPAVAPGNRPHSSLSATAPNELYLQPNRSPSFQPTRVESAGPRIIPSKSYADHSFEPDSNKQAMYNRPTMRRETVIADSHRKPIISSKIEKQPPPPRIRSPRYQSSQDKMSSIESLDSATATAAGEIWTKQTDDESTTPQVFVRKGIRRKKDANDSVDVYVVEIENHRKKQLPRQTSKQSEKPAPPKRRGPLTYQSSSDHSSVRFDLDPDPTTATRRARKVSAQDIASDLLPSPPTYKKATTVTETYSQTKDGKLSTHAPKERPRTPTANKRVQVDNRSAETKASGDSGFRSTNQSFDTETGEKPTFTFGESQTSPMAGESEGSESPSSEVEVKETTPVANPRKKKSFSDSNMARYSLGLSDPDDEDNLGTVPSRKLKRSTRLNNNDPMENHLIPDAEEEEHSHTAV